MINAPMLAEKDKIIATGSLVAITSSKIRRLAGGGQHLINGGGETFTT